ncbi:hypothetical protein [Kiloniella sp.]|uniref:hypothetical protein n=1 Tax=Kiloniella sp. TaxID=1938587 RepID=UPI003A8E3069
MTVYAEYHTRYLGGEDQNLNTSSTSSFWLPFSNAFITNFIFKNVSLARTIISKYFAFYYFLKIHYRPQSQLLAFSQKANIHSHSLYDLFSKHKTSLP